MTDVCELAGCTNKLHNASTGRPKQYCCDAHRTKANKIKRYGKPYTPAEERTRRRGQRSRKVTKQLECPMCGRMYGRGASGPAATACSDACAKAAALERTLAEGWDDRIAKAPPDIRPYYNFMFFDIESSGLRSPFGEMTVAAWCYSDRTQGVHHIVSHDQTHPKFNRARDHETCVMLRDQINSADGIATWYGKGFDIKFLNARLVMYGEEPARPHFHLDLCMQMARNYGFFSKRLGNVAKTLGLQVRKPDPLPDVWVRMNKGDPEAEALIVERCIADVLLTREVFPYLKRSLRCMSRG